MNTHGTAAAAIKTRTALNGWIDPRGLLWRCPYACHRTHAMRIVKKFGWDDMEKSFFAASLDEGDKEWHSRVDPGRELELRGWGKAYVNPVNNNKPFFTAPPRGWSKAQERFIMDACFKFDFRLPLELRFEKDRQ